MPLHSHHVVSVIVLRQERHNWRDDTQQLEKVLNRLNTDPYALLMEQTCDLKVMTEMRTFCKCPFPATRLPTRPVTETTQGASGHVSVSPDQAEDATPGQTEGSPTAVTYQAKLTLEVEAKQKFEVEEVTPSMVADKAEKTQEWQDAGQEASSHVSRSAALKHEQAVPVPDEGTRNIGNATPETTLPAEVKKRKRWKNKSVEVCNGPTDAGTGPLAMFGFTRTPPKNKGIAEVSA